MLGVVDSPALKRGLRPVPKWLRFSDRLPKTLRDTLKEGRYSFFPGMLDRGIIDFDMPEVVSYEFCPHALERECYIGNIASMNPLPVDQRDTTGAASARRILLDHFRCGKVTM